MVVKINAPAPHCSASIHYNETKVEEGKAAVVYSQGLDPLHPLVTLERYERGSIRCEKMSFHMSVNPSVTDGMTQDQVVEFTKEMMEGLGYGSQPFIVYRHNDIDREHYHVVSVRVDENGRKIPDHQEHARCQKLMKELAPKYGFKVGKGEDEGEKEKSKEDKLLDYQRFDPSKGEYMKQFEELVEQAMKYHFTTTEQFKMLMRQFGVEVDYKKVRKETMMTFAGIDPQNGQKCTAPIPAKDLKVPSLEEIQQHIEDAKKEKRDREKKRVANLARIALQHGTSELHTRRILRKKSIGVVFSKTDKGQIFGVTFIDHQTRCVFKSSELKGISAGLFEDARQNKWPPEDRDETPKESTSEDIADAAMAIMAAERSRRSEDEEIMRRGRRR